MCNHLHWYKNTKQTNAWSNSKHNMSFRPIFLFNLLRGDIFYHFFFKNMVICWRLSFPEMGNHFWLTFYKCSPTATDQRYTSFTWLTCTGIIHVSWLVTTAGNKSLFHKHIPQAVKYWPCITDLTTIEMVQLLLDKVTFMSIILQLASGEWLI